MVRVHASHASGPGFTNTFLPSSVSHFSSDWDMYLSTGMNSNDTIPSNKSHSNIADMVLVSRFSEDAEEGRNGWLVPLVLILSGWGRKGLQAVSGQHRT